MKNRNRPKHYEPRDGSEVTCEVVMNAIISQDILSTMPIYTQHAYQDLIKYMYRLFHKGGHDAHISDLNKIIDLCETLKEYKSSIKEAESKAGIIPVYI